MDFGERERSGPQLNIAPLIDVVFLLLVFFMLASSFIEPEAIDLVLPAGGGQGGQVAEPLVVSVTEAGHIRFNGLHLDLGQLEAEIRSRTGGDSGRAVTVRADAGVSVQLLVSILDAIRAAGPENIRLATTPAP